MLIRETPTTYSYPRPRRKASLHNPLDVLLRVFFFSGVGVGVWVCVCVRVRTSIGLNNWPTVMAVLAFVGLPGLRRFPVDFVDGFAGFSLAIAARLGCHRHRSIAEQAATRRPS